MVGVHPGNLTLRQLLWMSRGKRRLEWSTASALLAKIHNILAKTPRSPADFNPLIQEDLHNG
jgi:hypothetical protein